MVGRSAGAGPREHAPEPPRRSPLARLTAAWRAGGYRRELVVFVAVSMVVLQTVIIGALVASSAVAHAEARRDAEFTATQMARLLVSPLQVGIRTADPAVLATLDRAVRSRIEGDVLRAMVVWRHDGTVAYASAPTDDAGGTFGDGLLEAMAGRTYSELTASAHLGLLPVGNALIEVYQPVPAVSGEPLVLEIYVSAEQLGDRISTLSWELILLAVLPVLLLMAIQTPIAFRLARRVGRHDRNRAALLQRALSASDRERRAVAADLHDGVVQDLSGAVYVLARLSRAVPDPQRELAHAAESAARGCLDELRRLMSDIVPVRLDAAGLPGALAELVARLPAGSPDVRVTVGTAPRVGDEQAALAFRVAQEGLRNAVKHAGAGTVRIELGTDPDGSLRVAVVDDGQGIDPEVATAPPSGHLGLTLLRDRVADLDGRLVVERVTGGGTALVVVLPPGEPADLRVP